MITFFALKKKVYTSYERLNGNGELNTRGGLNREPAGLSINTTPVTWDQEGGYSCAPLKTFITHPPERPTSVFKVALIVVIASQR